MAIRSVVIVPVLAVINLGPRLTIIMAASIIVYRLIFLTSASSHRVCTVARNDLSTKLVNLAASLMGSPTATPISDVLRGFAPS